MDNLKNKLYNLLHEAVMQFRAGEAVELKLAKDDFTALIEENEKLKAKMQEAYRFMDSFIDEHENKEVRVNESGFGYVDVRLDEHIDWSELSRALKELSND